jgi:hypothetical protein
MTWDKSRKHGKADQVLPIPSQGLPAAAYLALTQKGSRICPKGSKAACAAAIVTLKPRIFRAGRPGALPRHLNRARTHAAEGFSFAERRAKNDCCL